MNPGGCRIVGASAPEEIVGRHYADFVSRGRSCRRAGPAGADAARREPSKQAERPLITLDGRQHRGRLVRRAGDARRSAAGTGDLRRHHRDEAGRGGDRPSARGAAPGGQAQRPRLAAGRRRPRAQQSALDRGRPRGHARGCRPRAERRRRRSPASAPRPSAAPDRQDLPRHGAQAGADPGAGPDRQARGIRARPASLRPREQRHPRDHAAAGGSAADHGRSGSADPDVDQSHHQCPARRWSAGAASGS